ncbi:motility-associated protein, partial [Thermodesulfovibrio sp. N1]
MDFIALLGLIIGICAVVVGNIVEGGTTGHLVQLAAAIIVFGGTIGAVLLSFPLKDLNIALKSLKLIFINRKISYQETIDIILELLILARRRGLLAIQNELDRI